MNENIVEYLLNIDFIDYLNMLASITIIISFVFGFSYMVYHYIYYRNRTMEIDNELEHKITANSISHYN